MTKTELFGVPFDDGCMQEAVLEALSLMAEKRAACAVTPNPEILMKLRKDPALRHAVRAADLILPDGVGVIYASRLIGKPIRNRIPGVDFASALMEKLAVRQGSVYLLGAKPGVAEAAAQNLKRDHPGIRIAGLHHGYFSSEDEGTIVTQLRDTSPDLLLVCLGAPRQELWMAKYARQLPVGLMIGLGGALDVYAGRVSRAPEVLRRLGLEWLYRLLQQPKRITRMMCLPGFLRAAMKERNRSRS